MSAAQAGQGTNGGGEGQAQGGEAAQGLDAAAIQQALGPVLQGQDQLRQQLGQFGEILSAEPWKPAPEADADPGLDFFNALDQGFTDPAYGDAERQQLMQNITGQVDQRVQQQIQQAVSPFQEKIADMQREQQIRDLVTAHPEFQDPEVANRIAGPDGLARQWAESIGQPELAQNPGFWRLTYMADRAASMANAEQGGADASRAATLEGGGGSGPAGGGQVDIAGQILDGGGRKGASVLPF